MFLFWNNRSMMRERVKIQILDAVRRDGGESSKKSIQAATGLAWGTVCKNVDGMIDEGILVFRKETPSGRGRPIGHLVLNPHSGFLAGLDLGGANWRVLFTNFMFDRLFEKTIRRPDDAGKDFCDAVFRFLEDALAESRLPSTLLSGIGLGISGNIDTEAGVLVSAANLGLKNGTNLNLRRRMEERFGVKAFLVTSQAAAVWAEYHFGRYAGTGNLITVGVGVGIGAAIVANHTLLPSRPDRPTGYIGHLYLPGIDRRCVCGNRGCIEAFSGGNSLMELARELYPGKTIDARALDILAASGDSPAQELLRRAADHDAFGIAFLVQMYHPDALIFTGAQCRADGFLFNELLRRLDHHVPPLRRGGMSVSISELGAGGVALGAARLYFENRF